MVGVTSSGVDDRIPFCVLQLSCGVCPLRRVPWHLQYLHYSVLATAAKGAVRGYAGQQPVTFSWLHWPL